MSRETEFMMDVAHRVSEESRDNKVKVGCVIAKDRNILSYGYNGTPTGYNNQMRDENNKTLACVIHAEQNALAKLAKSTQSGDNATAYCTVFPCMSCALSLIQAGIKSVYYSRDYKNMDALELFSALNINVTKLESKD